MQTVWPDGHVPLVVDTQTDWAPAPPLPTTGQGAVVVQVMLLGFGVVTALQSAATPVLQVNVSEALTANDPHVV